MTGVGGSGVRPKSDRMRIALLRHATRLLQKRLGLLAQPIVRLFGVAELLLALASSGLLQLLRLPLG